MNEYTTKYLRADSYESFFDACDSKGLVGDGEVILTSHNHSIVLLGVIYKETGNTLTDSDGNQYQEKEPSIGYHANLRYKESVGLEDLEIEVDSPSIVFA